jgi:hypothetical protein
MWGTLISSLDGERFLDFNLRVTVDGKNFGLGMPQTKISKLRVPRERTLDTTSCKKRRENGRWRSMDISLKQQKKLVI